MNNVSLEERIANLAFNSVFVNNAINQLNSSSPIELSDFEKEMLKGKMNEIRIELYQAGRSGEIETVDEVIKKFLNGNVQYLNESHGEIVRYFCNELGGAIKAAIKEYNQKDSFGSR